MSPVPHRIYSQELSRAFKRGHPIANPQPVDYSDDDDDDDDDEDVDDETSTLRPVEIGDVGYIQHDTGLFIRLFNVHLEPGVDGQPARENLPGGDDFRPLRKGRVSKSKDATPVFVSQSVESVKLNAAASGPFFGGSAGFTASSKRGAILATPDPIESQNALNIPSYIIYARAHIKGWHAFYSQRHLIELEDIMLVTGVDRTTSWATAVFSDTKLEVGFGLDVQFVGAGPGLQLACQYSWRSTFGAFVNSGPVPRSTPQMSFPHSPTSASQSPSDTSMRYIGQGEHETERQAINTLSDQTLFIRHIRAKRRPWSGLKLQARGEKDDTNDESDGSGSSSGTEVDSVDIASYPRREKFVDCLEPALDYILQTLRLRMMMTWTCLTDRSMFPSRMASALSPARCQILLMFRLTQRQKIMHRLRTSERTRLHLLPLRQATHALLHPSFLRIRRLYGRPMRCMVNRITIIWTCHLQSSRRRIRLMLHHPMCSLLPSRHCLGLRHIRL
ncbi:hypothetical protein PENSPDRAFT_500541 [Peniophora sp. CONT]|nr:hypothetical protein PENSPDRAFT_500541 [Peniophora sp. CONT]